MLEIKNLRKTYKGGKIAVDNLSITIENGDIYGFIGHNGAGKTTTMKSIAGIINYEGSIIFDGKDIKEDPVFAKKDMAYIPDNPDIYEYLTGIQYLNFIADIYDVSKENREKRIKEYSDKFELTSNLGDLISSYSHGMKQKLVLISALIHRPKLLLLDEPFVGLDPIAAFTVKSIMQELCSEGMSVFFSTHVLDVAEKICNKIAIIKQGKLIVSGLKDEVVKDESLESVFLELSSNETNNSN